MPVDCPIPSSFDMLHIYDNSNDLLMEIPLCEVIKGNLESVDQDIIKMKSIEDGVVIPYNREDFLLEIQNAFQKLHMSYVEIIVAKDQTKVRI